jgi:cytochrome P450
MDLDVFSPDLYTNGVPHERFERLRKEAPVSFQQEPGGPGFWSVTKYRDVVRVLRDATTFSSEAGGTQIPELPPTDIRRSPDVLAVMDPPRHTQYRALVGQAFTRRGLLQMEPYIQGLVDELLDEAIARGTFDFVGDFSARLPMAIILTMVGVPLDMQATLNDWVLRLLATDDPEYATSDEERAAIGGRFMEYAHALASERRKHPRDDLLSLLMAAEVDGQKLTYHEFGMFFMLLLAAGTDTPRLLISSGMLALMDRRDLRDRLVQRPATLPGAIEEFLRFYPPLTHFRRTATKDTEIRGQLIREGQKVVVWLASANRDDEVFPDASTFDIERTPNDHLSFGHGPHFCIGNALARMSAKIAFTECLRRLPHLELTAAPERLRSNWLNGMKRMPVVVTGR